MSDPFIDTSAELDALCARLGESAWFTFDTEFIRDRSYYPKLCLMQVADARGVALIDPLALDPTPLFDLLFSGEHVVVLHSAEQDLECLYHIAGRTPPRIFDTQVAAALLGARAQISYAELVERVTGLRPAEGYARTDWARRPLPEGPRRYAADDVRYLRDVYEAEVEALEDEGRLGWLADDFADLVDPSRYAPDPAAEWLRVKGRGKLSGPGLAALQALAAWREEAAMRANRPRRWIEDDRTLVSLAQARPEDGDHPLLREMRPARRREVLAVLAAAEGQAPRQGPPRGRRPGADEEARVARLLERAAILADDVGVEVEALVSRKHLTNWVTGYDRETLTRGWRGHLLRELLLEDVAVSE
jgi:ribonuclease D